MAKLTPETAKVGDGATGVVYTDSHAFTIIKVTPSTITVQRDKVTRLTEPEIIPGGFMGHCVNNDRIEYSYEADPDGDIVVCHWSNKLGHYTGKSRGYRSFIAGRYEHHDYNF